MTPVEGETGATTLRGKSRFWRSQDPTSPAFDVLQSEIRQPLN